MNLSPISSGPEKGFSLIEVVFAISILAIAIMGYTNLKVSSLGSRQYGSEMTKSTLLVGGQLEEMLLDTFESNDFTAGTHILAQDLEIEGFTVSGSYSVRDACPSEYTKLITFTGTWNVDGTPRSITLTQVIVNQ